MGKKLRVISGKLVSAGNGKLATCPQDCNYDGSSRTGTDDFSSVSGWTVYGGTGDNLRSSGGHGLYEQQSAGGGAGGWTYAYRSTTLTVAGSRVIIEANVFDTGESATTGVFFGGATSSNSYQYALFARWGAAGGDNHGAYVGQVFKTSFSESNPTPADGDKLTLDLEYLSADNKTRLCLYNEESFFHTELLTGNVIAATTWRYGIMCSKGGAGSSNPVDTGEWDDFEWHIA